MPSHGPRSELREIVAWPGGFAVLGKDGRGRPVVWTSRDGSDWSVHRSPARSWPAPHLGAIGDRLVIVTSVSEGARDQLVAWSSTDGIDWRRAPDQPGMALPLRPPSGTFHLEPLATANGRILAVGSWEGCCGGITTPFARGSWVALAMAAAERQSNDLAWTSTDGVHWERQPVTASLRSIECLVGAGDRFLAVDYDTPLIASSDGVHWSAVGDVPMVQSAGETACVVPTRSGHLQVGRADAAPGTGLPDSAGTAISADGVTWSAITAHDGMDWTDEVAVLGDLVVLDGWANGTAPSDDQPMQVASADGGATWQPIEGWPSTTVATDGRVVVAVGDGAWVAPLP
ncbi:MAG: hypothetical protein U0869_23680 [Chloroflexota bacterium]